jgi:hypothetical protein
MKHYISLGIDCYPATQLRKKGNKTFTFPFDWCITPMNSVLYHFETDFVDFLMFDNLVYLEPIERQLVADGIDIDETIQDIITPVICMKTGSLFPHDFSINGKDDYDKVKEKYNRRITRMYDMFDSTENEFVFVAWHKPMTPKQINNSWRMVTYRSVNEKFANDLSDKSIFTGWQDKLSSILNEKFPNLKYECEVL